MNRVYLALLLPFALAALALMQPPTLPPITPTSTRAMVTVLPPKQTPTPRATEIRKPVYRYWFPWVSMGIPVCEYDGQTGCATPTLAVPPTEIPPTAYP